MNVRTKMVAVAAVAASGVLVSAPAAYSVPAGPATGHVGAATQVGGPRQQHGKKPKGDGYGTPAYPAPSYHGAGTAPTPSDTPSAAPSDTPSPTPPVTPVTPVTTPSAAPSVAPVGTPSPSPTPAGAPSLVAPVPSVSTAPTPSVAPNLPRPPLPIAAPGPTFSARPRVTPVP